MEAPTPILALSPDTKLCYKEWHSAGSLSEEVKKNGGRILTEEEEIIGRLILCPEDRKNALLKTKE